MKHKTMQKTKENAKKNHQKGSPLKSSFKRGFQENAANQFSLQLVWFSLDFGIRTKKWYSGVKQLAFLCGHFRVQSSTTTNAAWLHPKHTASPL